MLAQGPYVSELPLVSIAVDRNAVILAYCKDKRVLHIGCVDSGLTEERYLSGTLLHARLANVASELWGIDIDKEGLRRLRIQGFENLGYGNAEQLAGLSFLAGQQFDIIVAAEILEHLANPGLFLSGVKPYLLDGGVLIITVPNAFRGDQPSYLVSGRELVHPEHICWYSYTTLSGLLARYSYRVVYGAMCGLMNECEASPFFARGLIFLVQVA